MDEKKETTTVEPADTSATTKEIPMKNKSTTKKKISHKVRVNLPGIESYEKDLQFPAEAPGRVVVRLERLMGSDRIRITDPKYLSTLVDRLEEEEAEEWKSRSRLRKKNEKMRSRQLAINGLMEPTQDMQDLYNHPVFRVNRVLNRLAVLDTHMSRVGPVEKPPPIQRMDLFTPDDTGKIFKTFPGHNLFATSNDQSASLASPVESQYEQTRASTVQQSEGKRRPSQLGKPSKSRSVQSKVSVSESKALTRQSTVSTSQSKALARQSTVSTSQSKALARQSTVSTSQSKALARQSTVSASQSTAASKLETTEFEGEGMDEDEAGEEDEDEVDDMKSLEELKQFYGIPDSVDLLEWKPYRAELVDKMYREDMVSYENLYGVGEEVVGVFERELQKAEENPTSELWKRKGQLEDAEEDSEEEDEDEGLEPGDEQEEEAEEIEGNEE